MLNHIQNQVLEGSLLGDGCLTVNFQQKGNCSLVKSQSKFDHVGDDKRTYIEWHYDVFREHTLPVIENSRGYSFRTRHLRCFTDLEKKWYKPKISAVKSYFKRTKIIPADLKLTPLSLCVWYMDDGYNCPKDAVVVFCTNAFTVGECEFLCDRLRVDLNINHTSIKLARNQPMIRIRRKSYFDFMDIVKSQVAWDCFKYKIDTSGYTKTSNAGSNHGMSKLTEEQVVEMFRMNSDGRQNKEIAQKFNVCTTTVAVILNGKHWRHLGLADGRALSKKCKPHLTKTQADEIIELRLQGLTCSEISERYGVSQGTVSRVTTRKTTKYK